MSKRLFHAHLDEGARRMFEFMAIQPADPILSLIALTADDRRPHKVDLGVGVYRDERGRTPIMSAVKAAEARIFVTEQSKAYIGPEGDKGFVEALWTLLGGAEPRERSVAGIQTPGGSSALRMVADLICRAGTGRVLIGLPGWSNHGSIFRAAGVPVETYPCFDVGSRTSMIDRMIVAFERGVPGDVALLQGGCHNPTGARLLPDHWDAIASVLEHRGIVPLVDVAYQGFGQGLDEDAAGVRALVARLPEVYIAVSASKTFGLYRERVGALYATLPSEAAAKTVRDNFVSIARVTYSMPPAHGAAIVRTILTDDAMRRSWADELESMRGRLVAMRHGLAARLAERWPSAVALTDHEGMFCQLPLRTEDILALRSEHAIYMPLSGRINVAGLSPSNLDHVARCLVDA